MSQLRAIVERIERIESEIADMNSDKSDIFKEAKATGFDVKALKAVIAYRRKDPTERDEQEALFDLYLAELSGKSSVGTPSATRVHVHETKSPEPAAPATTQAQPSQTAQALQASVAIARSGGDPFEVPDLPAHLDRRVRQ